jgi:L-amino acid N-acyltransferase YncA
MQTDILILPATDADLPTIADIYTQAIGRGGCTADTVAPPSDYWQDFLNDHPADAFPLLVAHLEGRAVGWLSISPYRKGRFGLRFTAEVSYYVHNDFQGRGIGSMLMRHAIGMAPQLGLTTYIAILLDVNQASIRLLERYGFARWGHLPGVADFDGREMGQYYYGRRLG